MKSKADPAKSLHPLIIFLSIYALVFFALAYRKFNIMNSDNGNIAISVNAFWHTIQGKLFYTVSAGMNHLGVHATYLILLFTPIFALFPHAETLLFMQTLMITASGLPFFLISRKVLQSDLSAWCMTIAYLFYPTVVTNHVNQVAFEHLALPFLIGAVWFFLEQRFWVFLLCAFMTMTALENLPLTVGIFGVYALINRRSLKWVATPILLALAYELFVFNVAIPHFSGGQKYYESGYLGAIGSTPSEAIRTCLTQPWKVITTVCDLDRGFYLLKMFQPLLWIVPLCSWEIVLALPSLALNLIIGEPSFRVLPWHYNPTVGAMLCTAAIFGAGKLAVRLEKRWHLSHADRGLAFAMAALSLASWPLWFNPNDYIPHAYYSTLKKVLRLVPPNASVLSPHTMIGHLADRDIAILLLQFDPNQPNKETWPRERMYTMDYVILDANERRFPQELVTRDLVVSFYTNTNYQLIFDENNVFVFQRRVSASPSIR
jgi:uncharacterized membrane protein